MEGGKYKKRSNRKRSIRKRSNRKRSIRKRSKSKGLKCWKGYVRVPGKKPGTPGSCRKK